MENFWSLLKRDLCAEPTLLWNLFIFHATLTNKFSAYNNRKEGDRTLTDADRFAAVMSKSAGRRLTYCDLTGKSDSPHHATTGTGQNGKSPF